MKKPTSRSIPTGSRLGRRQFLLGAATIPVLPKLGFANTPTLTARPSRLQILPDIYPETDVWGFDGKVPGPEIRLRQGDLLSRQLINNLPEPTSVHWHGVRLPNAMDGVPGITQAVVDPGDSFTYDFTPPDAGTFWYHSHNRSTEQVARGLYGLLIVEEPDAPDVDHDIAVVLDDWRLNEDGAIVENFAQMHDLTHAGRLGNYIHAVLSPNIADLQQNQRLRLRMANVATDRIMTISLRGLAGAVVALDGMPLVAPETVDRLTLGPAQRADLIVDVTAEAGEDALIASHERDGVYAIAEFKVSGQSGRVPRGAVGPLPPNPIQPKTSVGEAREVALRMEGGAMGGLREGIFEGRKMSIRDMVQNGQAWTFNGVAGMTDEPLVNAALGETIRIPIVNDTAFPHAVHLHGHHFQEVQPDGAMGPLRDTILVQPGATQPIVFTADNPGDWLIHCHMLSHQAAGMKTWVRVG